jgi:transposase
VRARAPNHGKHYTREDLEKALKLKASGLSWGVIAERFGRSYESLARMVHAYRSGKISFSPQRYEARRKRMVWLFEHAGVTVLELAKMFDIFESSVCQTLDREGIDAEERAAIRKHWSKRREDEVEAERMARWRTQHDERNGT